MTAKEKAEEILKTFDNIPRYAKKAVDELIKEQTMWQNGEVNPILYWQEVKQEIELLIEQFKKK